MAQVDETPYNDAYVKFKHSVTHYWWFNYIPMDNGPFSHWPARSAMYLTVRTHCVALDEWGEEVCIDTGKESVYSMN